MDDKDWMILKIVAEEMNITKAAERLYISQPAITYRLKNLEKEFKAKIIIRTPSGILLTSEGEQLLDYANTMLRQLTTIKDRIQNTQDTIHGSLRLGVSSMYAHYLLPQLLTSFMERYPNVDISLKTGLSYKIQKMLQQEEISVAILRGNTNWSEEKYLLAEESICLVSLHPIEIAALPFHPKIEFKTDYSLQDTVKYWWQERFNGPPLVNMFVDNIDTCRQLVLRNLGWSVIPAIGLREQDNLFSKELFLKNGTPLVRQTWMLCRKASLGLSVVRAFVQHLEQSS